jgi:hypothetical protein
MAIGDVISVITGPTTQYNNYQPAAGVEIIVISAFSGTGTTQNTCIFDGTDRACNKQGYSNAFGGSGSNTKIGITNSVYLAQYNAAGFTGFSGIQIK